MESAWIRWLDEADAERLDVAGGKGASLARLLRLAFPVPMGFVITIDAYRAYLVAVGLSEMSMGAADAAPDAEALHRGIQRGPIPDELRVAILSAYRRLEAGGAAHVAVRSSGIAEDLATASFAGQHDTFLDVAGEEALLDAVRACWASLWAPRAVAYRSQRGWDDHAPPLALAVVVQVMVPAEAAGVAFTADPVTGDRHVTTISAVRGLGERLVSGEAVADEWVVRGNETTCLRAMEQALTGEQALDVAHLANQIARASGTPQDVEWAIASGELFVLQARPMTALPEPIEPVVWVAPAPGGWMRNFRVGEWLPEPVTPLCDTWLLASIEAGEVAAGRQDFGLAPRQPYHVLVNGWYFSSPIGGGIPIGGALRALLRHPRRIAALALSLSRPEVAEKSLLMPVARRWRDDLLPRYQTLVASWEQDRNVNAATPTELFGLIDAIGAVGGEYLWAFSVVGGHAWKVERALAAFCKRYLPNVLTLGHQELLLGLPTPFPETPPHAVQSLDWVRPTLGETVQDHPHSVGDAAARHARLRNQRHMAEAACRAALASQPRVLRRFDALLALAQRYAVLREEQAGWFTLGWPLLRRAVTRLGDELRGRGVIERAEDIFFLTRDEVAVRLLPSKTEPTRSMDDLRATITTRRREWESQRRLSPPLSVGAAPGARVIARAVEVMRVPGEAHREGADHSDDPRVLRGMPASPGRASGVVRVIRGPEDFGRFLSGEVLVAQVTAPAWTPLFARAAAVVTDGGSLAAHASLVAREYGIPAVVGASEATARLRDGQHVTVDGSAGVVELAQEAADGSD